MNRAPAIEPGTRFGILTALEELPTVEGIRWQQVRCDCGIVKSVRAANLRNGSIVSCGCNHSAPSKGRRKVPNVGSVFGRWTFTGGEEAVKGQMHGRFRCVCGTERLLLVKSVVTGKSTSCGCAWTPAVKHGKTGTHLYTLWKRIKSRCSNPKSKDYKDYGARGIVVYGAWASDFSKFESYVLTYVGERPSDDYSLDRVDNNLGYVPGNIRWASHVEQANNRRNSLSVVYLGKEVKLSELSKITGIPYDTLHSRIFVQGWDVERASNTKTPRMLRNQGTEKPNT